MLEAVILHCPYCGESFESSVDLSAGDQDYIEDCAVCCKPIRLLVRVDENDELRSIETRSDSE